MKEKLTEATIIESMHHMMMLANTMAKHAADIAHARRCMFDAYRSEGFTDEQALELCKSLMMN